MGQHIGVRALLALLIALALLAGAQAQRALRPLDRVRIECEEEPTISREYRLSKQGALSLQIVPPIGLAGRTEREAEALVLATLHASGVSVARSLRLRLVTGASTTVTFRGAVRSPGSLPFSKSLTLAEIIRAADPTRAADLKGIVVTSWDGSSSTHEASSPVELKPGDDVFFPLGTSFPQATVVGAVANPGSVEIVAGARASWAIQASGGLTAGAERGSFVLVRRGAPPLKVAAEDAPLAVLQDGDTLFVPFRSHWPRVLVAGAVLRPGLIEARKGLQLGEAIALAGGALPVGDVAGATVQRLGPAGFARVATPQGQATELLDGDVVQVPVTRKRGALEGMGAVLGILRYIRL